MKSIKTLLIIALTAIIGLPVSAQDETKKDGYQFKDTKIIPHTSVKSQDRSGTCWSFSTLSFIESELLKKGKPEMDLSEMFVVHKAYSDKAKRYVRMHGNLNFGGGGAINDITDCIKKYGMMPESAYVGLEYGTDKHTHGELDILAKAYVDAVLKNKNRKLTPVWHKGFEGILDAYLGEIPATFEYEGVEYTPRTFADEYMEINPDDYIMFSSYTHHPFYEQFIIEVPDNWSWGEVWNVKIDDMIDIMDNALEKGYTIAWASDISEKGFSWTNGVCTVPDEEKADLTGTEREKWEKLSKKEKESMLYSFDKPMKEKYVTQEMRQEGFDNYTTTDDHGMHIIGTAKDVNGTEYYKVKNSWGVGSHVYEGYFYVSKQFIKLKTMSFMVNKKAVPKKILKKLKK